MRERSCTFSNHNDIEVFFILCVKYFQFRIHINKKIYLELLMSTKMFKLVQLFSTNGTEELGNLYYATILRNSLH